LLLLHYRWPHWHKNTDALKQQVAVQKLNLNNEGDIIKLLIAVASNFKK